MVRNELDMTRISRRGERTLAPWQSGRDRDRRRRRRRHGGGDRHHERETDRQRPIPTNDGLLGQDIDRGSNEGAN